uniref:MARVEL domain-containing protein n=1 Tax=Moniliophthora roreri TaxID=221103 RepID=A0A0W0G478_MONRR
MAFLPVFRLATLITTLVFAVVILGLNAHLTWITNSYFGGYFSFAALSIATAILTILTLPVMIWLELSSKGKGAFIALIITELIWLGILWVLWLASAAKAADDNSAIFPDGCNFIVSYIDTTCREFAAIVAFNFLTWFALSAYTVTVLVLSILSAKRGNPVWFFTVREGLVNNDGQKDPEANGQTKPAPLVAKKQLAPASPQAQVPDPPVPDIALPPPLSPQKTPATDASVTVEPEPEAKGDPVTPVVDDAPLSTDLEATYGMAHKAAESTNPTIYTEMPAASTPADSPEQPFIGTAVDELTTKKETSGSETPSIPIIDPADTVQSQKEQFGGSLIVASIEEPAMRNESLENVVPVIHTMASPAIRKSTSADTITLPVDAPQNLAEETQSGVKKHSVYPEPQE